MRQRKNSKCITRQMTEEEKIKYGLIVKEERKIMNIELQINDKFKNLLPPLSQEEFNELEKLIIKDGCTETIKVWKDKNNNIFYIIDGHNRYKICKKHNIDFQITEKEFDTYEDVLDWIIKHQFGRRNINDTQKAYLRGLQYENEKKKSIDNLKQYNSPNGTIFHSEDKNEEKQKQESFQSIKTAERIGQQHQVSERAIREDGKFANALDKIGETIGIEAKNKILNKEKVIAKQDVIEIGNQINEGVADVAHLKKEILESEDKKIKFDKKETTETKRGRPKKEQNEVYKEEYKNAEKENSDEKNEILADTIEQEEKQIIPNDNIKEIIKDMKTPKYIVDTFNFLEELDRIKENINYSIDMATDDLFERYDIDGKITQTEKDTALECFQEIINNIKELKNKIINTNIKEIN